MDNNRPGIHGVGVTHFPDKVQDGSGVLWYTMIRPDSEVELLHNPLLPGTFLLEGEGPDCVLCQLQYFLKVNAD